ncbi:hypothetical protein DC20_08420 [Rufibacter tibetensis]|uniref:FAS1 domain-containing protein n=1 Tax=Rufibacter tibetensis TaxID=512763 RepID=A0A0P0C2S1_9BACT|nr:hypothetical protein DC20_08420 [Rufibacter tibetensis]
MCLWGQLRTDAQSLTAKLAATASITNQSLGEGIAQKNQLLLDMVTKAGLMPILSNGEEYTLFAPSASALTHHQNDSPDQLKTYLEQHIVKGSLTTEDLKDGADLKTINGNSLRICRKKGELLVSGVKLAKSDQRYLNGVWHQLNGSFQASKSTF